MIQHNLTIRVIDKIFNARSIAVVGASGEPHKFGYMTLDSLIKGGYDGRLYPINPKSDIVQGLKAYPSVSDVPDELDAVVIVVPAKFVAGVLREAAQKGAQGAIIQSAGFREAGRADLEKEIIAVANELGIRFIGPNIQGINFLPNKLCAMFFPVISLKGPLAVVTQSGTITTALSEWAENEGLGISAAVNLGNQADLCEADFIDYFSQDEHTKAIVMYLESIKNGRKFLAALERAALTKPLVILKVGRTSAGAKSAASHTGAMGSNHEIFCAACRQFGALVPIDLQTLYDQAKSLGTMRPPRGNRVLIISTSGGAATIAADEAGSWGLNVPNLPPGMTAELSKLNLPPLANLDNPIDLGSLDAEHFQQVALLADRFNVADTILMSFGDPVKAGDKVVIHLARVLKSSIAVSYMGGGQEEAQGRVSMQQAGIPVFPSPERALRGIAAVNWRARYRNRA